MVGIPFLAGDWPIPVLILHEKPPLTSRVPSRPGQVTRVCPRWPPSHPDRSQWRRNGSRGSSKRCAAWRGAHRQVTGKAWLRDAQGHWAMSKRSVTKQTPGPAVSSDLCCRSSLLSPGHPLSNKHGDATNNNCGIMGVLLDIILGISWLDYSDLTSRHHCKWWWAKG